MTEEHIEDKGYVTAVNGNKVTVELIRGGGCKSCAMQGMCFKKSTPAVFTLETSLALQKGDSVQLEISPAGRTVASLMVFGLPLVLLFIGFIIASRWLVEIAAIGVGFAAMGLAFLCVRLLDNKLGQNLDITIARKL